MFIFPPLLYNSMDSLALGKTDLRYAEWNIPPQKFVCDHFCSNSSSI